MLCNAFLNAIILLYTIVGVDQYLAFVNTSNTRQKLPDEY